MITLLITLHPQHPLAWHPHRYAKAFLQSNPNKDLSIFFYSEGANVANALSWQTADRNDLTKAWRELASQYDLRLPVCVGTALARGVTDAENANRHGLGASSLAEGFELVGLGVFAEMMNNSDKIIQF